MVKRMDGSMGTDRASTFFYSFFGDGDAGGSFREARLFRFRCPPSLPPNQSPLDWAEWNWQIHRAAGHCPQTIDLPFTGWADQADGVYGEVNEGGDAPGSNDQSSFDNPRFGVVESVLEGEIQRGDDPLYHGSPGPRPDKGEDEEWRKSYNSIPRVLHLGGVYQGMVARNATHDERGRWLPAEVFDSQGGLQVSESSRSPEEPDRSTEEGA